jgi:hypothetical protein
VRCSESAVAGDQAQRDSELAELAHRSVDARLGRIEKCEEPEQRHVGLVARRDLRRRAELAPRERQNPVTLGAEVGAEHVDPLANLGDRGGVVARELGRVADREDACDRALRDQH